MDLHSCTQSLGHDVSVALDGATRESDYGTGFTTSMLATDTSMVPADTYQRTVESLLDILEGCLAYFWESYADELPSQGRGDEVIQIGIAAAKRIAGPLSRYLEMSPASMETLARLHNLVLAFARHADVCAGESTKSQQIWQWIANAESVASFQGIEAICWELITTLGSAHAVMWRQGMQLAVESTFLCLADVALHHNMGSTADCQAIMLTMGRTIVKMNADNDILSICLPLASDCASVACFPEVVACACFVLAQTAAAAAKSDNIVGFQDAVGILIGKYQLEGRSSNVSLLHSSTSTRLSGELAKAITFLAHQLTFSPPRTRLAFEVQLLALFVDVALMAKTKSQLYDLGSLLPAIAATWNFDTTITRRADAQIVKLYRLLWLYVALHDLAGIQVADPCASAWPLEWRNACVTIAQHLTPEVVVGGLVSAGQVEADFGERLQQLRSIGASMRITSRLVGTIFPDKTPVAGVLILTGQPARSAHLLATLTINLLRAELTTKNYSLCPLAPLFSAIKVAPAADWISTWLQAITEHVFLAYTRNLSSAASTIEAHEAKDLSSRRVLLAAGVIECLQSSCKAAQGLAETLLGELLQKCKSLVWQPEFLYAILLVFNNLRPDDNKPSVDPKAWNLLEKVLGLGGRLAPGFTEASVHELLQHAPDGSCMEGVPGLLALMQEIKSRSSFSLSDAPSGVTAMQRRFHYAGKVSRFGMNGTSRMASLEVLTSQLRESLGGSTDYSALQDRMMSASAALTLSSPGAVGMELIGLICQAVILDLQPSSIGEFTFAWQWISASTQSYQAALLAGTTQAWLCTIADHAGIYQRGLQAAAAGQIFGDLNGSCNSSYLKTAKEIQAQHALVMLLHEAWQVWIVAEVAPWLAPVFYRWAHQSIGSSNLTHHPAAGVTIFRMLNLSLWVAQQRQHLQPQGFAATSLCQRVFNAALHWFSAKPAYFGQMSSKESREQVAAFADFHTTLTSLGDWSFSEAKRERLPRGISTLPDVSLADQLSMLTVLVEAEIERLEVWSGRERHLPTSNKPSGLYWQTFAKSAWNWNLNLAICAADRFPRAADLRDTIGKLVTNEADHWRTQKLPGAAAMLVLSTVESALVHLQYWAPASLLDALQLISRGTGTDFAVRAYALRSLYTCSPEQVAFFLPQLVQLLRSDTHGMIKHFLTESAMRSVVFAHRLICTLRSEGTPPAEAFNPAVKRSGWQPPVDSGLWKTADAVEELVWKSFSNEKMTLLKAELSYFGEVTSVSGQLYPVAKDKRKSAAVEMLGKIHLPRQDLWLPTNPESRVIAAIAESATPMQSAAKVPILVAFKVEDSRVYGEERIQACMFKVGDDCRQDVLALQVIALLKGAFQKAGLPLYLAPYGVLPTSYECGVIEVVPHSKSRSTLGEVSDGGLLDIWRQEFGHEGSHKFEEARTNFILSEAGYAIACYLLQAKDRHNGNILVDSSGHLIHIDFGFILEISPGGNLGFESAAFKLSHEMTQLLDPSGKRTSPQFHLFQDHCIRGFLAARTAAEGIIATVELMSQSGLPCYSRGTPLANLRKRFHLEMSDAQAASFMHRTVRDAYDKWTTGFYDFVQYLQNSIPK